jgi:hypothetical protein
MQLYFLTGNISVYTVSVSYSGTKTKVNLSLCLTKHHAMKAYWGVEV